MLGTAPRRPKEVTTKQREHPDVERSPVRLGWDRSERPPATCGNRLRALRSMLVAAVAILVSSATNFPSPAAAGTREAVPPPQYQAESRDITAGVTHGLARPYGQPRPYRQLRPAPVVPRLDRHRPQARSAPQSAPLQAPGTWYQIRYSRYRFTNGLTTPKLQAAEADSHLIAADSPRLMRGSSSLIDDRIYRRNFPSGVIPARDRSSNGLAGPQTKAAEKKRLLVLGLALGLAYIAFLAGWFWKTRGRPHGAGRVVRF
jgi:hypothetical protein